MSGARVRGRPAERSDWGCPERVWPAVRATRVPDTGTGHLPRKRRTNFSTGFPRALRRKEVRAALSGGGQRRVHFAPATGAARSGPALTPLRCQRPAGKRQDVIDVERPKARSVQLAHQLPCPSPANGTASAAAFALFCLVIATAAAPAPIADAAAPFDPLLTRILPPMGDPPPGLRVYKLGRLFGTMTDIISYLLYGS